MSAPNPIPASIREYLDINGYEAVPKGALDQAEVERLREHDHICADIIQENDDLGAEVERLDRDGRAVAGRCLHYEARAEQAEAAIARVRALCDEGGHAVDTGTLRAAIDGGDDE